MRPKDLLSLEHFRERLSHIDALPQLLMLGVLSGLSAGLIMLAFRLVIDIPLALLLPGGNPENFEALSREVRFALPIAGSLLLILLIWRLAPAARKVGIAHVLERLSYHQGHLPGLNVLVQFATASIALLTGHSVGREGPAVHLGAGGASLLGQWLRLPNNSMRLLVGCGTAAGISAAFDTPLAGVIFAMEVVLQEYSVLGFTPIMVSAVTADLVLRAVLGAHPVLDVPAFSIGTLSEIPFVMLLGLLIGLLAGGFNRIMLYAASFGDTPLHWRLLLAGVLTGAVALVYPQVMGVGYDTVGDTLMGRHELLWLAGLLLAKWLLTPVVLGLGVPAGLIGPTFFIGSVAGALIGSFGQLITAQPLEHAGLYSMVGMGSMMGAVLNAPLASLIALLELTGNPNIILPGMLAIVISNLTVRHVFGLPSIFESLLRAQGLDYHPEPLAQALSRAAVGSLMQRTFIRSPAEIDLGRAELLSQQSANWILVSDDDALRALLPRSDLMLWLEQQDPRPERVNLLEIPAQRRDPVTISSRATLKEAADCMQEQGTDILCVSSNGSDVTGLLTGAQLESYYLRRRAP